MLAQTNAFLADIMNRRKSLRLGHENVRAIESIGGSIIEPTAFEPDPNTHRSEYYYNAVTNALYKRSPVITHGQITYTWKKASW